ncbi:MAG: response regulator [Salinivirgaceae bacterium]|nr:response regulator [Salinivirgaceae bacterium]MDD4746619.1 response regulator [Salinivirgaceae bacterium]MDY0279683.1 response regulator [Salinivirgaceae bacterium]
MLTRLLIIDDDIILREIIKDSLGEYPIIIDEAANGVEGLKKIAANRYDVILTDIIMPEKEGFELIMEIKSNPTDIKIIATTSGGSITANKYLEMAMELGADAVIAKPFSELKLVELINKLLGKNE